MSKRADLRAAMTTGDQPAEIEQVKPSQPGRAGTVLVAGHFDPAVRRQLKGIALDQDRTVQDLLAEALNDLFAKYSKPEIAPARNGR